jgi:hypothetical protein
MHPTATQLPVESDFVDSRSQDLDERHAVKMFLGKTPEQAEAMFRENFLFYQEDLLYMRATAFRFHVVPAIRYLLSEKSTGDSDAVSTFCNVLESRLKDNREALTPIAPIAIDAIRQILDGFTRYDCSPEIYGDIIDRYRKLRDRL